MGQVVGDLLPLAVGVMISPVPIIAVILMLLAPRARTASLGFAVGWVAGIVVVTTLALLVAGGAGGSSSSEPSTGVSWTKLVLGVLLLLVGLREWRGRPPGDEPATLPTWMNAIDSMTAGKALGLGFLLSALNPKNLLLCVSAGVTIAAVDLSGWDRTWAVLVFTLIAAASVLVPVIGYLVAANRVQHPLDELRSWLQANNAVVMAVLLLVLGVALVGKGLGGLL